MYFYSTAISIVETVVHAHHLIVAGTATATRTIHFCVNKKVHLSAKLQLEILRDINCHILRQDDIIKVHVARIGTGFIIIPLPGEDQFGAGRNNAFGGWRQEYTCMEPGAAAVIDGRGFGNVGKVQTCFYSNLADRTKRKDKQ